jgi:hypothetical protein
MKSVLIGADILKLEDGYKLLEINTDADLFLPDIPYLDLDPLFTYLEENSYTKLVIIHKKKHIAPDVINHFQLKCNAKSITLETILIMNNSVTVPSIIEEANTFYLRCAYDVTAIIDDTYCRDKSEVAKLLFDSGNESILPKTYVKYSEDGSILDNLSNPVDNGLSPNIIAKKILPDFDKLSFPAFYNIESSNDLDDLKTSVPNNVMLQEYKMNGNLSPNGQISNVIRMTVILLSDVETIIPLGITVTNNQLPLDTSKITYTGNKLDDKWKSMYFSNPNLLGTGVPGFYEVVKIVDGNEEITTIETLVAGDIIKSARLTDLSVDATMEETMRWSTSGSLSDIINYETASVHFITKTPYQGWLTNLEYGNGEVSGSSLLGSAEVLLISSSISGSIVFETAYHTTLNDSVITTQNLMLPITNKENVWYSGSIVILDIEPVDVFVAGTPTNEITRNTVGNVLLHNKCAWSGFCCFANGTNIATENGDVLIEEIKVGDLVWSYNFETQTKELKKVLQVVAPMHDDIVNVTFSNGRSNENTFDHPYYTIEGSLSSYLPERTKEWYNGDVNQLSVGTTCLDENNNGVEVTSITENLNNIQTYTLFVEDNKNFYANGILVYDEEK